MTWIVYDQLISIFSVYLFCDGNCFFTFQIDFSHLVLTSSFDWTIKLWSNKVIINNALKVKGIFFVSLREFKVLPWLARKIISHVLFAQLLDNHFLTTCSFIVMIFS